jgi:hypothetical protein
MVEKEVGLPHIVRAEEEDDSSEQAMVVVVEV